MSNVLLLHENEQPTVMSIYAMLTQFFYQNEGYVQKQFAIQVTEDDIDWADVIVCVRGNSPRVYSVLRYAKELGKTLIYFLDDDLKDLPKGSFMYPERKKWLIDSIRQCSIICSSNQLIVDEYLEFVEAHRGAILHTAVRSNEIITTFPDTNVIKIVYAASESHTANFNRIIAPLLPELFKEYGRGLELHLIGLQPKIDLGEFNSQIHYIGGMPLNKYDEFMRTHHYDIGLAPLVTTHFTERKYYNKYIEYSKVGICGIYSDVMPFKLVVKDGWNGYMSVNTPDAWLTTIKKTLEDKRSRERIVAAAQEHLKKEHSEKAIYSKLAVDIPELIEYKAPENKAKWPFYIRIYMLRYIWFRICETVYLSLYSLKHFGMSTTINKIRRKIKIIN